MANTCRRCVFPHRIKSSVLKTGNSGKSRSGLIKSSRIRSEKTVSPVSSPMTIEAKLNPVQSVTKNPGRGIPQKSPYSRIFGAEHSYCAGTLIRSKAQGPRNATSMAISKAIRHFRCPSAFLNIVSHFASAKIRGSDTQNWFLFVFYG